MDVIAYSHTHWDREWYHPFEEFRLRFIDIFDDIINKIQRNELSMFYLDAQTILIDDYLEIFPEKKELIQNLIKQKKLLLGPWYVLNDELLPCGENLIRSLLIGINDAKKLGCNEFVGYLPDSFGHNAAMPAILKGFGIKNAIFWRGGGNKKSEFIWRYKDGSEVLTTYLIEGYFQDIFSLDINSTKRAEMMKNHLDKIKKYNITNTILLPVGADHLASVDNLKEKISDLNEKLKDYNIKEGSIFDYIKTIKPKNLEIYEGELRDNSRNYVLPGVYSTRTYIKQQNVRTANALIKLSEPLQTLCETQGLSKSRKAQLDHAWKIFSQNNPHDSICGCSVDEVHREMLIRYEKINQITNGIIARIKKDLIKKFPTSNIISFNSSNYFYNGIVKFTTNKKLPESKKYSLIKTDMAFPFQKLHDPTQIPVTEDMTTLYTYVGSINLHPLEIKAFGYNNLNEDFIPVLSSDNKLENEFLKFEINNGEIKIFDKKSQKVFDIIHSLTDYSDCGDTYNYAPVKDDEGEKADFVSSKLIFSTPHIAVIEITYKIDIPVSLNKKGERAKRKFKHIIKTNVILKSQSKILEFETKFENKSKDHMLLVDFHMKNPVTKVISEDTEGLIERTFNPDFDINEEIKNIPYRMELKTNTAPLQRFVCTQNVGILSEGLQEYSVNQNKLSLTLLRATGLLSNPKNRARMVSAGPPLKVEEAQCLGKISTRYGISIYEQENELFEQADIFLGNIISFDTEKKATFDEIYSLQLFEMNNKNIYLQSLKKAEDKTNSIILRLVNLSSKKQILKIKEKNKPFSISLTNLSEEVQKENLSLIEFKPFELLTVKLTFSK